MNRYLVGVLASVRQKVLSMPAGEITKIANSVKRTVGSVDWSKYKSPTEVIKKAWSMANSNFVTALLLGQALADLLPEDAKEIALAVETADPSYADRALELLAQIDTDGKVDVADLSDVDEVSEQYATITKAKRAAGGFDALTALRKAMLLDDQAFANYLKIEDMVR